MLTQAEEGRKNVAAAEAELKKEKLAGKEVAAQARKELVEVEETLSDKVAELTDTLDELDAVRGRLEQVRASGVLAYLSNGVPRLSWPTSAVAVFWAGGARHSYV
jgi:hypothetical protein